MQASYQVAKARRTCFLILRSFHTIPFKLALFKQRVRPQLEVSHYASSFLMKSMRLSIEGVQRRFTKALFPKDSPLSYLERCELLKLDPLWLRRLKLNLVFLHSLLHRHAYIAASLPTFRSSTSYPLRNITHMLPISRSRTSIHYNSFFSLYSRIWNKLPLHIRSIESHFSFKHHLYAFLSPPTVIVLLRLQTPVDVLYEQGPPRI